MTKPKGAPTLASAKAQAVKDAKETTWRILSQMLTERKLPLPHREYLFAPPRMWRFDFCWPSYSLALEVDGGNLDQRPAHPRLGLAGRHREAEPRGLPELPNVALHP